MEHAAENAAVHWIWHQLGEVVGGAPKSRDTHSPSDAEVLGLSDGQRKMVSGAVQRIIICPAVKTDGGEAPRISEEVFGTCMRGVLRSQALALRYHDRNNATTERRVEPYGLVIHPPRWYLLCFDIRKKAIRSFRLDRIESAHFMIGHRFEPPEPDELFAEMEGVRLDSAPDGSLYVNRGA